MTEKLRPEQRKLWRRIYLTAFENGANAKEAAYEADTAVLQWEARGAFEVDPHPELDYPTLTPMFNKEHLTRLREVLEETDGAVVNIKGIDAGRAIQWDAKHSADGSVVTLTITAKSTFSLLH